MVVCGILRSIKLLWRCNGGFIVSESEKENDGSFEPMCELTRRYVICPKCGMKREVLETPKCPNGCYPDD